MHSILNILIVGLNNDLIVELNEMVNPWSLQSGHKGIGDISVRK